MVPETEDPMNELHMTIDGKAVATRDRFDVINPASGKPFAQAPECTRAQLDDAMQALSLIHI